MRNNRETLKIINSFALKLISLPSQNELAWFVAREVVGKLGFEDCVVYFFDADKNLLRQIAAIGDHKNPTDNVIRNPLEIEIGHGITGHVAKFHQPVIIRELAKDDRYIPDVDLAQSEICVPLIADGTLFGVIDCESPLPHHFTTADLETLSTVAAMASAKLKLLEQDKTLEMNERLRVTENELLDALHAAETANQTKSEFLATISHELRTPLTSIKGALGLMKGTGIESNSADQQGLLEMALRNCDSLVSLVDDILDYEKIIAGKMTLKMIPTDIGKLAQSTVEANLGLAQSLSIQFRLNDMTSLMWAETDPDRYAQILRNLLSNAGKFSPKGSFVDISVNLFGSFIRTTVEDRGIGIADEHQADIFNRFTQIDMSDTREQRGTGLGLAISKSLATDMNGCLSFESTLGQGSVFYLDLPKIEPRLN